MTVTAREGLKGPKGRWGWPIRVAVSVLLALATLWLAVLGAEPLMKALSSPTSIINEPWLWMYQGPWVLWRFGIAWDLIGARLWMGLLLFAVVFGASLRHLRGRSLGLVGRILGWTLLLLILHEAVLMDVVPLLAPPERRAWCGEWGSFSPQERVLEVSLSVGLVALWLTGRLLLLPTRSPRHLRLLAAVWVAVTFVGLASALARGGEAVCVDWVSWLCLPPAALLAGALTALGRPAPSCRTIPDA